MAAAEDLPRDLAFVDLETTGGNPVHDRITEVGIVRLREDGTLEEWSTLVNPERPIPAAIQAFTGISDHMVASAPRFADIAAEVRERLKHAVFVAHNARFDYAFLRAELRKADRPFSAPVLCTVKLSRRLFPEHARHNLDAVMERNGLTCDARHRALGDARVIRDLWVKLRAEIPADALDAAARAALGLYRMPAHLPADLPEEVPEGPGAFRFFGEDGTLLYVGRSESLRSGVCGRLALDREDADRRLADRVYRVDWVETAGDLGAQLQQSAWIKAGRPIHNRRPKPGEPHTLKVGPPGATAVEAVPIAALDRAGLSECHGLFQSEKDARKALTDIARARGLCLKVLGLDAAEGSCVAYQMGKCKGACIGKEPPVLHDMRTRLALSPLKLKAWPFRGRVAIRERRPWGAAPELGPGADLHVIDGWSYLGTARCDEALEDLRERPCDDAFDPDIYRILVRYLGKHPDADWVDLRDLSLAR